MCFANALEFPTKFFACLQVSNANPFLLKNTWKICLPVIKLKKGMEKKARLWKNGKAGEKKDYDTEVVIFFLLSK